MDSLSDDISRKIKSIRQSTRDLLNTLSTMEKINRDDLITQHYTLQMQKNAPWFYVSDKIHKINTFGIKKTPTSKPTAEQEVSKVLDQMRKQPDQKNSLLQSFINSLKNIPDADKGVIFISLRDYPLEKLQKELLSLKEII